MWQTTKQKQTPGQEGEGKGSSTQCPGSRVKERLGWESTLPGRGPGRVPLLTRTRCSAPGASRLPKPCWSTRETCVGLSSSKPRNKIRGDKGDTRINRNIILDYRKLYANKQNPEKWTNLWTRNFPEFNRLTT